MTTLEVSWILLYQYDLSDITALSAIKKNG